MKIAIKLQIPDGEKVFPLAESALKTKGIAGGTLVSVELNEAGTVIDLHRAEPGAGGLAAEHATKAAGSSGRDHRK
jgi:hypothetical protein